MLKQRYECPCFRILVIGRANAGKTTILEKVCGVAQGTQPIIYDENGVELEANIKPNPEPKPQPRQESNSKPRFNLPIKKFFNRKPVPSVTHFTPSMEVSCMVKHMDFCLLICQRGIHDIEHQITYPGSSFIFHDSQGFEAGESKEIEIVWKFIEKKATAVKMEDQLHAIWYIIFVLYIAR